MQGLLTGSFFCEPQRVLQLPHLTKPPSSAASVAFFPPIFLAEIFETFWFFYMNDGLISKTGFFSYIYINVQLQKIASFLLGGRAPGVDEIRPDFLKALDVVGLSWLARLCGGLRGSVLDD